VPRAKPSVVAQASPVSGPLSWDELDARLRSDRFTVATLPRRLRTLRRDPWRGYANSGSASLPPPRAPSRRSSPRLAPPLLLDPCSEANPARVGDS
jgi:DNA primase